MPHQWTYTDVYSVVVHYINNHLIPQNYSLNFGVVALCLTSPKVYLRLTLRNLSTNQYRQWEVQIEGSTIEELTQSLHISIETNKALL